MDSEMYDILDAAYQELGSLESDLMQTYGPDDEDRPVGNLHIKKQEAVTEAANALSRLFYLFDTGKDPGYDPM